MTRRPIAILVVLIFTLNAAALVWMRLLPEESFVLKGAFAKGTDIDAADTAKERIREMAGTHYVELYRKHRTANTIASIVLLLDACFLLAMGIVVCCKRQMREAATTEPADSPDA